MGNWVETGILVFEIYLSKTIILKYKRNICADDMILMMTMMMTVRMVIMMKVPMVRCVDDDDDDDDDNDDDDEDGGDDENKNGQVCRCIGREGRMTARCSCCIIMESVQCNF